jgi:carotenoid cleavage dioxygenase
VLTDRSPFLQGPFEPLLNSYLIEDVRVEGEIPRELCGTLYRNASNQHFHPVDPARFHWFDGDGMVHAFRLENGRASYRNRHVETDALRAERAAGRALYNGLYGRSGVPQGPLPAGAPPIKTAADVNVVAYAGRILALHEADSFYWELDPGTLKTLGKFDFGGAFDSMLTGHPHVDPHSGETLFYALDCEQRRLDCFAADSAGHVRSRYVVELPVPPFVHDFIFTQRFYVFAFGPIRWRPYADRVPAGRSSMFFDGQSGCRVLLVDRSNGRSSWFETESFTAGHYLNAWDEDGRVVVDLTLMRTVGHDPSIAVEDFFPFPQVEAPSPFSGPELHRMTISLGTGQIRLRRVGDFNAEFVRLNEAMAGQPQQYGYMAGVHQPPPGMRGFNCLVKHDYRTGRSAFQYVAASRDMTPGEPVFVPRASAVEEDDGWVMAVWWDHRRNTSEMVILAAKDFDCAPVARVKLDHRVPLGFHGNWVAAAC